VADVQVKDDGDSGSSSGLELLSAIADHQHSDVPLTPSRLAAVTGRDRGLVNRVVDDLCDLGLVERAADGRSLQLGWGLFAAAAQLVERRAVSRGQPLLERLALHTGESAYLVRRQASQSFTMVEAMPRSSVRGISWLGRSLPVVRGDAGPVLLMDSTRAQLRALVGTGPMPASTGRNAPRTLADVEREIEKVRATGVSVLIDQVEAGVSSVGSPVRDFRLRLVGAVVVVGPTGRIEPAVESLVSAVRLAAAELSAALGAQVGSVPA
jgi:DNA-binding IclR family transcriptional regulator